MADFDSEIYIHVALCSRRCFLQNEAAREV